MSGGARLLAFAAGDPAWNMAVDEALVRAASLPTLRLYGWSPPAISLGRFQKASEPDVAELLEAGLPVVRRMTGGGAIVHWHEVTYSLTVPEQHDLVSGSTRESYAAIHAPIRRALENLGVRSEVRDVAGGTREPALCFHRITSLDLVIGDLKLVGSAQRRTEGRVLQHGSIVLKQNPLQPGTADLESALGRSVEARDVVTALVTEFSRVLPGLSPGDLDASEQGIAEKVTSTYRFS